MANDSDIIIQATFKYTEEGAEEVIAANKAIEESTAEMSQNTEQAATGIAAVGKEAETASTGVAGVAKESESAGGGFNLMSAGGMMTAMMFVQMAQMAGQLIGALAQMDEAVVHTQGAFAQLMGSSQAAQHELSTLNSTWAAAKFGTQAIDNVAQHLLMSGEDADTANKQIMRVSDAVAAAGGSAQQIQPIIDKLISMQKEGKITEQDMQDLVNQGLPAWDALAEGMGAVEGKTVSVEEAIKRVKAGAVSGNEAYKDMLTGMMKYSGAAQEQSSELSSQWTRFGQEAGQAFGPVLDGLAKFLKAVNDTIQAVEELRSDLGSLGGGAGGGVMSTMDTVLGLYTNPAYTLMGFLPGHAEGIIDSPAGHFATVGEDGPETMFIPKGASIFPSGMDPLSGSSSGGGSSLSSLASLFGGGDSGGGMITVNITHLINLDGRTIAAATIPYIAPMARIISGRRV